MSRVRFNDIVRTGGQPPVVVWWCDHKPRHLLLRVFLSRDGWTVARQSFREPLADWLARADAPFTLDDVRAKKVVVGDARRVDTPDKQLPLDVEVWPAGRFEMGCRCGARWADIADLADDCRRARDERRQVVRHVG